MYCVVWAIMFLFVILVTAIVTLQERKFLADVQSRRGPSKTGYFGILQPIADAIKLLIKENIKPRASYDRVYLVVALLAFFVASLLWNLPVMTYENTSIINEWVIMLAFLISILHIFTILFAGWSSNSRYSFLGAIRTSAQLIAYDIVIVLTYLNLFIYSKEFSFESFFEFQNKMGPLIFFFPLQFVILFISFLAETSRHPYDLPEAEAELVAGYNVEYSSIRFAMFFLAEYSTVVFTSIIIINLFFGGFFFNNYWIELFVWSLKVYIFTFIIIEARGLLPRYRYDQLMEIGWKFLIPIQCLMLLYNIFIIFILS